MNHDEHVKKSLSKAVAKAWSNERFLKWMKEDPKKALSSVGLTFAAGVLINVSIAAPSEAASPLVVIDQITNEINIKIPNEPPDLGISEKLQAGALEEIIDFIIRFTCC